MSDAEPTFTHPLPSDPDGWAVEIAAAAERVESTEGLRLEDGSLLEPDDGRDAVVLAMVFARGLDCDAEDIGELVTAVSELDEELTDDNDIATITIRYLACHSVLDLIPEPDTEFVASLVEATRKLIES